MKVKHLRSSDQTHALQEQRSEADEVAGEDGSAQGLVRGFRLRGDLTRGADDAQQREDGNIPPSSALGADAMLEKQEERTEKIRSEEGELDYGDVCVGG